MDVLRPFSGISFTSPSPRSARFSDAFATAPKRPKNKVPTSLRTWIVCATISVMVALALALEIALHFSNKQRGFAFGHLDTEKVQWFSGFVPTLAIGPLVWMWRRADKDFKKLQPYVTLSQGPAKAQQTVLLDLEHQSLDKMLKSVFKNGYFLVLGTTIICLLNVFLHPLAGSLFLIKQTKMTSRADVPVRSTATVGLNPAYKDVTSFVAAAGFAEAAAFHNLSDPPFIQGGWAVAKFKFLLDATRNSTLSVRTTGVRTNVSCSTPENFSLTQPTASAPLNWTLTAALASRGSGCSVTQSIDSTAALSQYGVEPVPGCAPGSTTLNPFAPVLFWYFTTPKGGSGAPVGAAVFCAPSIAAFDLDAAVDGVTGLLVSVNASGNLDARSNNVTGGQFAGKAFNGISFDSGSDFNLTDSFVRARAVAVQSGVPGAIFRLASDTEDGGSLDAVFANATGFLGLTEKIYTQYLSVVASANYFVPTDNIALDTEITLWPDRLWISPISAHALAAFLILVAVAGTAIHLIHRRQRKRLFLASRPGSMAHYMSLLSHPQMAAFIVKEDTAGGSASGGVVGPLDNMKTMRRKLRGVQFMLDERTGALVPVGTEETWQPKDARRGSSASEPGVVYELEDARKSLLGSGYKVEKYRDPYDQQKAVGDD